MAVDLARWLDILELMIGPLELGAAALVYAAAPRQWANRSLAALFVLEGFGFGGLANGLDTFAPDALQAPLFQVTLFSIWCGGAVYLLFIAASLDTPLTRPVRTPHGRTAMATVVLLTVPAFFLLPRDEQARFTIVLWAMIVTAMLGMAATVWAFAGSPAGSAQRKRAGMFVAAFACRDVPVAFIGAVWLLRFSLGGTFDSVQPWASFFLSFLWLPFVILVAYGTLRGQLFDVDERVQAILRRVVLVGAVAIAFFGLSEGLETIVPFDSVWLGLLGAGLVALALLPLQRLVSRGMERVMPKARDPGHQALRKEEVYRAAYESAIQDGRLGKGERRLLDGLRGRLGLSAEVAMRIEAAAPV